MPVQCCWYVTVLTLSSDYSADYHLDRHDCDIPLRPLGQSRIHSLGSVRSPACHVPRGRDIPCLRPPDPPKRAAEPRRPALLLCTARTHGLALDHPLLRARHGPGGPGLRPRRSREHADPDEPGLRLWRAHCGMAARQACGVVLHPVSRVGPTVRRLTLHYGLRLRPKRALVGLHPHAVPQRALHGRRAQLHARAYPAPDPD